MQEGTANHKKWSGGARFKTWQMFDRIAKTYDLLNHVLSGGMDILWRRKMARMIPNEPGLRLLDLATGTGDQLITACKLRPQLLDAVGMDLSEEMLAVGRQKLATQALTPPVSMQTGDAVKIPAEDNSFDALTITFGIRNVEDVNKAIAEMYRVLKPGGRVLIMEFAVPQNPVVRFSYLLYFRQLLPRIGGWVSGDKEAYAYLNQSAEEFPAREAFGELLEKAGFQDVQITPLTMGIAYIYQGIKC